ncbi:uncharacterized protein METZ01_LOCUS509641, partial [marine metagenome]
MGIFGLIIVVILVLGAVFAPYLTDYAPNALDIKARLAKPSGQHWLGADHLGRDTFTRVLYGGRVALKVAAWSISLALFGGVLLGMLAGYGPRWLDNLLILIFDAV